MNRFLNLGLFSKYICKNALFKDVGRLCIGIRCDDTRDGINRIFVDEIQIHRSHVSLLTLLFSGMCDNETVDGDLLRSRSTCRSITTPYLPLLTPLRDLLEIKARRQRQNWRDCVTPAGPGGLVSGRCTGT